MRAKVTQLMKICIPDTLLHSNDKNTATPIYSINVHPTKELLASGGQDCSVKLWDVSVIEASTLLGTLISHQGM